MQKLDRQEAKDMTWQEATKQGFDIVQIKYDGNWGKVGYAGDVFSRTNMRKGCLPPHNIPEVVAVGEYMRGTTWSKHPSRAGLFYLFDIYDLNGKYDNKSYEERYLILLRFIKNLPAQKYNLVKNYPIAKAEELWQQVNKVKYEGLIFRKSTDTYSAHIGRQKREVTSDYYIVGVREGSGRLSGTTGALALAVNPGGEEVMAVGGGLTDSLRDQLWNCRDYLSGVCVEVKGNGMFPSGALRHPNFIRFREDKTATNLTSVQPLLELLTHQ